MTTKILWIFALILLVAILNEWNGMASSISNGGLSGNAKLDSVSIMAEAPYGG